MEIYAVELALEFSTDVLKQEVLIDGDKAPVRDMDSLKSLAKDKLWRGLLEQNADQIERERLDVLVGPVLDSLLILLRALALCELFDGAFVESIDGLSCNYQIRTEKVSGVAQTHGLFIKQTESFWERFPLALMVLTDDHADLLLSLIKVLTNVDLEPDKVSGVILRTVFIKVEGVV